eukprot:Awhi_evm1s10455
MEVSDMPFLQEINVNQNNLTTVRLSYLPRLNKLQMNYNSALSNSNLEIADVTGLNYLDLRHTDMQCVGGDDILKSFPFLTVLKMSNV